MKEIIITEACKETEKLANCLSCRILKLKPTKRALVIGLIGELGSGKTVFAKGFAKGLGIKKIITSPTFVLEKIYELPGKKHRHFVHIDVYRMGKAKELADLGFKDLARDSRNIILIEWADKVKKILPKNRIEIKFEHTSDNKRKITIGHLSDCYK